MALPLESIVIPPPLEPICIDVGVICTLLFESLPIITVVPLTETKSVVPSLNFSELLFISTCSVPVLPIVVVEENLATPAPLSVTVNPVESTRINSSELSNIFTPLVGDITIASSVAPWAPPNVQVVPRSSAIVVSLSINFKLVASTTICSVANVPTVTFLVKNACSVNRPKPGVVPT